MIPQLLPDLAARSALGYVLYAAVTLGALAAIRALRTSPGTAAGAPAPAAGMGR